MKFNGQLLNACLGTVLVSTANNEPIFEAPVTKLILGFIFILISCISFD